MKKAQYFITCKELPLQMQTVNELSPQRVRSLLLPKPKKKVDERQLLLILANKNNLRLDNLLFKSDTKRKSSNSKFNCKLSNSNLNSKS